MKYQTEPFKCWGKAKELRNRYYENYLKAHERGGLRVSGSAGSYFSFCMGLGWDVYNLAGEPYGASTGYFRDFAENVR